MSGQAPDPEDVEALAEVILAERLTARELPNSYMDDAELLNAMKPRAAAILASDWLASHDAALIEKARAEGKAEADAAWVAKVKALVAPGVEPVTGDPLPDWVHVDHIRTLIADAATALDEVRAQAKAEGLREAAEHLAGLDGIRWPIEGVNEAYVDWLRGRARRLGGAL